MALTRCTECKGKISNAAEICPHCGIKRDVEALGKEFKASREKSGKSNRRIIKLLMIAVGITWLLSSLAGPGAPRCPHTDISAYLELENQIKKRFKSPSTVKFSSFREAKILQIDCYSYEIIAYADAQNSFGATVRSDVSGKVVFVGEDGVRFENIEIRQR